eukprot:13989345-Alexandrium_andersonii.AAC.1
MARSPSALSTKSQTTARIEDTKSPAPIRMARARCAAQATVTPHGARRSRAKPAPTATEGGVGDKRALALG